MLSLNERLKEIRRKESEEKCSKKSTEKRNKTRNKHITQNHDINSEENQVVDEESKADVNRSKSGKRTKTNNCIRANKMERKPLSLQSAFFLPYLKNSFHSQIHDRESFSKELLQKKFSEENTVGGTNNVIFVSLDFIEDCQKYKKKFIKPKCDQELKTPRKSLRNISSHHKRNLNKREQTPKSERVNKSYKEVLPGKRLMQKKNIEITHMNDSKEKTHKCLAAEDSTIVEKVNAGVKVTSDDAGVKVTSDDAGVKVTSDDAGVKVTSDETGEACNYKLSDPWDKLSTETFSVKQSINVKPSSQDVSTVDKKYIESLLSIANCNETKQKMNVKNHASKHIERDGRLMQSEKKKITGKIFFENKIKKEKQFKNGEDGEKRISECQNKSAARNDAPVVSQENTVFARLVRDLTKSEVHILPQKRKNPHSGRYSEIEGEKKTALSKPEVNENRKKRKTRNNVLKNNNEDFIEMPFPCQMSKVADIKELWKRGTPDKSENSLSSRSSSTVHENEETECKTVGLESYKILRKIVEEEIKTICKKFAEKKTEDQEINLNENENVQMECNSEPKKLKSVCKELRTIMFENPEEIFHTNISKIDEVPKKLYDEEQKPDTNCGGKKEKEGLLKYLDKHETEDLHPNLLEGKKKLPSHMIKNWSILHRLEQAFLALGTPTFPNREKDPNTLKVTGTSGVKKNGDDVKIRERGLSKKLQKNKDTLDKKENKTPITPTSTVPKNQRDASETRLKLSSAKTVLQNSQNKKVEDDNKQPLQKDKPQEMKNSINGTQEPGAVVKNSQNTYEGEDKSKQKKGKSQNQKTNVSEIKKSPPRSLAKPKACDFESRYSKRDVKQKKYKHNTASKNSSFAKNKSGETKGSEMRKKKPSKTLVSNVDQKEGKKLERKETFDVIPLKASPKIKSRKSKSCNKMDDSLELDSAKKGFPPTRSTHSKNPNFRGSEVNPNVNNKIKNDMMSKMKPHDEYFTKSQSHKTPVKDKSSQPQERPKTVSEKDCFRGNRDGAKDRVPQEKKCEKIVPIDDIPRQILTRKETPNGKDRAVKERSILSMRGNQGSNQAERKNFLHLHGKNVCNPSAEPKPCKPHKKIPLLEENNRKDVNILLNMCAELKTPESISFSCASTCTFDVSDCVVREDSSEFVPQVVTANVNELEVLEELSSMSSLSLGTLEQQQTVENTDTKNLKGQQPLWEYDIKQYRTIVKEIMSHYKRIDGFLKENEHSQSLPNDSVSLMSKDDETNSEPSKLSTNLQDMDIHEYRQKILSEYQKLPIFEYKNKLEREAGNNKPDEKRRNLSFVKALETEMDLDVKDFQPNIHKILDSQLYVDTENIFKRNEPYVKFNEKKSSLQEIILSKNENEDIKEEECLRCISTPKTFLTLHRASVHSSSVQNLPVAINTSESLSTETLQ